MTKSTADDDVAGPYIGITVIHDTSRHRLSVPADSTFGQLKSVLAEMTGVETPYQRLLFRGKERKEEEKLHNAGVKEKATLVLLENKASRERREEQAKREEEQAKREEEQAKKEQEMVSKASRPIMLVRSEVDKLAAKVDALESAVRSGTKVGEKELLMLTELLMVQLLKLDGIEAEGEVRVQRKNEVRRIQSYVDKLDMLKAENSNVSSSSGNNAGVKDVNE